MFTGSYITLVQISNEVYLQCDITLQGEVAACLIFLPKNLELTWKVKLHLCHPYSEIEWMKSQLSFQATFAKPRGCCKVIGYYLYHPVQKAA